MVHHTFYALKLKTSKKTLWKLWLFFNFGLWGSSGSLFLGDASLYGPVEIWVILCNDLCALLLVNNWHLDMFICVNIAGCSAPIAYGVFSPICDSINKINLIGSSGEH